MDFDHRSPEDKKFHISDIVFYNKQEEMLEEIAKCDLVCANCHRIRTFSKAFNKYRRRIK